MKIFIISHKPIEAITDQPIYEILLVGQAVKLKDNRYYRDDQGINISQKNWMYNELTGVYWVWKNVNTDIIGICHYRRYFVSPLGKIVNLLFHKNTNFLREKNVKRILQSYQAIVHNKTYFRSNNKDQFCMNLNPIFLEITEIAISEICPEYLNAYRKVLERKYAHLLNMVITKKKIFDRYCEWLFPILFRVEEELVKNYSDIELSRSIGMIGERLLDVWLFYNEIKLKECFTINTERIDWKVW